MSALLLALLAAAPTLSPTGGEGRGEGAASSSQPAEPAPAPPSSACAEWAPGALPEGPVTLGYIEADLASGRRACPRTEVALGARFGAIIDTANFYGNLGAQALLSGSWALNERTELYGTFEAVRFTYLQTALKATQLTVGHLTLGGTRVLYQRDSFAGALTARLLLPTSFGIPGARLVGAEVGHASTWRPHRVLEVHTYLGVDVEAALSAAQSLPGVGGVLLTGVQVTPWPWASLVVDLTGRLAAVSYLAPTVALRFRVSQLGIELGASLPVAGEDRHDFLAALRLSWRI